MKIKKLIVLILISLSGLFESCEQNAANNGIPYVFVDVYVYTTDPAFIDLSVIGGWTYITGGSRGIIIYRSGQAEFMAFDRHTPFSPNESCAVAYVEDANLVAVDPCSETKYSLFDGTVIEGQGSLPLQRYQTTFDNNVLHIFN